MAVAAATVKVVLLVPYRVERYQNREHHLTYFLQHVPETLNAALGADAWAIIVVEQTADGQKFSRGRCLNAAARLAATKYPGAILVLHDVDLIPTVERAKGYGLPPPPNGVLAFNSDSAQYATCKMYIGGVCAMTSDGFFAVNGFQNGFQGWGGEDDCLRDAIQGIHAPDDRSWLACFTEGRMLDLETLDPPTCKRACVVLDFKCDPATKVQLRRQAVSSGFSDGLKELVFEVVGVKHFPDFGRHVCMVTCNLFVELPPGWCMAMSRTNHVPYYYKLLSSKESTYVFPGTRPVVATAVAVVDPVEPAAAPVVASRLSKKRKKEEPSKASLKPFCS